MYGGDQFYGGDGEMPLHYKVGIGLLIFMVMLFTLYFLFGSDEEVGLPASEIPASEKIQYGPYVVPIGIDTATEGKTISPPHGQPFDITKQIKPNSAEWWKGIFSPTHGPPFDINKHLKKPIPAVWWKGIARSPS
jgi:hypothetical protein